MVEGKDKIDSRRRKPICTMMITTILIDDDVVDGVAAATIDDIFMNEWKIGSILMIDDLTSSLVIEKRREETKLEESLFQLDSPMGKRPRLEEILPSELSLPKPSGTALVVPGTIVMELKLF